MANRTVSRVNIIAQIQLLIAGLEKHLAGQTIVVGGVSITVTDLIAELTAYVAQLQATTSARATWAQAVLATRALEASKMAPLQAALSSYLEGMYGPSAGILTDFGLKPRKKPARTVQNKAEAVEKNLATRVARGTKGSRQKAGIHGTVPAPATLVAAPTATAAAPASAVPEVPHKPV